MKKIVITESQLIKMRDVLKEQESPVFKMTDVDGDVTSLNNDSLEFELILMGEDQNGDDLNKTINLEISLDIEDSEPRTNDHPGYGGGYEWDIVSARQTEPEEKELTEDDIMALYSNSMIVKHIEDKVSLAMDNYEGQDNRPEYDPNDDIMESIKKNFNRFL